MQHALGHLARWLCVVGIATALHQGAADGRSEALASGRQEAGAGETLLARMLARLDAEVGPEHTHAEQFPGGLEQPPHVQPPGRTQAKDGP